ncbi:hypothetical protein HK100_008248 [Physocladia obscura]|uniref:Cyclic nucleotide-binding domain-containing protein n=1 Tax=Physocladia obscura TaxID=109957 RepID=A0AAD5SNK1_9FUNG|nr:hypothetical protein HK100_008248 [Physocladia obscura]
MEQADTATKTDGDRVYELEIKASRLERVIEKQKGLIGVLQTHWEQMRSHTIELVKRNDELRTLATTYLKISQTLSLQKNLSDRERELIRAFENVKPVEKDVSVNEMNPISPILRRQSLNRKSSSRSNSQYEISLVEEAGRNTDVVVLRRRKAKTNDRPFIEEHPHMDALLKFPLFSQLPQSVMENISLTTYEMSRKEGQIVIQKGEESAEIFFLLEGVVSVLVEGKDITDLKPCLNLEEVQLLLQKQIARS